MASAAIVGSTGFVGGHITKTLLASSHISAVVPIARRPLPTLDDPNSLLRTVVESDSAKWAGVLSALQPTPTLFFSALGTTRAQAGGVAKQRKIDFDLNLELARAAKEAGVRVYVLVSSAGVSTSGMTAYQRMKAELDEAVAELGFDKTVILRPGFLCGDRQGGGAVQYFARRMADTMGKVSGGKLKDGWAQDADVVARAAVKAGLKCVEGDAPDGKVWMVNMAEIIELGKM